MKRIIVTGDIHGNFKGLKQCLERSNFDYENDTLIQLGDIVDGWNEVYQCVDELLKIKNLISIKGNHDDWFNTYLLRGVHPTGWSYGGEGTLDSYCINLGCYYDKNHNGKFNTNLNNYNDIPQTHRNFFNKQLNYYKDEDNNVFVHGGFARNLRLKDQTDSSIYYWDRDLWLQALGYKSMNNTEHPFKIKEPVKEIYIGHTTTMNWDTDKPMNAVNIWNLDTGSGFKGKLTFMDINTKEYWQSDRVDEMYKDQKGRN